MSHQSHKITRKKHTWLLSLYELKNPFIAAIHSVPHKLLDMTSCTASSLYCWHVRWFLQSTTVWGDKTCYIPLGCCHCLQWRVQCEATKKEKSCFLLCTHDSFYCTLGYHTVLNFLLAGNQPVCNTKHSVTLPAKGTVLTLSSWDMTCHFHAILLCWNKLYASHCPWRQVVKVYVLTHSCKSFYVVLCFCL